MDIQQLRQSLKVKWLLYYRRNRPWMTKLRIWGTYDGQRRPSSSFILATLTNLEPQLIQMFPFIVALSNHPDQIIAALGLNFNPEVEIKALTEATNNAAITATANNAEINSSSNGITYNTTVVQTNGKNGTAPKLPVASDQVRVAPSNRVSNIASWVDESCTGVGTSNS
ncbi:DUF5331 domain-containing protein [Synechocystis sp. PCC 7509]|uniref:DUF5331 domain-containing protein n=1 Tax=Synechocystis sp. PCC 7509 TaxID=927677 RepID=UPI0002ABFCFF|nr:DUF5331 domain-containing protein [Synechocystis sp. PCC 7509]